jgi:hypothetical protein
VGAVLNGRDVEAILAVADEALEGIGLRADNAGNA